MGTTRLTVAFVAGFIGLAYLAVWIVPLAKGRIEITAEASEVVDRVVFFLDGEKSNEVSHAPFSTKVRLGRGRGRHIVEAIAYDSANEEIARDFLVLNPYLAFDQLNHQN